jgi:hypothetical protein
MFQFEAPYPGMQTTVLTPNPLLSDTEALAASMSSKRAVDGTLYTYVKTKGGRRKMTWTLRMRRPNALTLRAFLLSYFASKVRITDHNGRVWVGNFTNNPFEFETPDRAGPRMNDGLRSEIQTITIEFEGVEQ